MFSGFTNMNQEMRDDKVAQEYGKGMDNCFGHMAAAGQAAEAGNEAEANRQAAASMGSFFQMQRNMAREFDANNGPSF